MGSDNDGVLLFAAILSSVWRIVETVAAFLIVKWLFL